MRQDINGLDHCFFNTGTVGIENDEFERSIMSNFNIRLISTSTVSGLASGIGYGVSC